MEVIRRRMRVAGLALPTGGALVLLTLAANAQARDVPYVPTPAPVVEQMLDLAGVSAGDVVYDLGSGDGRIVVAAARRQGVRAVGVDIDPVRVLQGRRNAARAGVARQARFYQADLFEVDLRQATVVTLYLFSTVNMQLRPKLLDELRPGARVVSHAFGMGDWEPDQTVAVEHRGQSFTLYLWIVPAQVEGTWTGTLRTSMGEQPYALELRQQHQRVEGMLVVNGQRLPLLEARLVGDQLDFLAGGGAGKTLRLSARLEGDRLEGQLLDGAGRVHPWSGHRQRK
jgi:precorrin-6B methylase 2